MTLIKGPGITWLTSPRIISNVLFLVRQTTVCALFSKAGFPFYVAFLLTVVLMVSEVISIALIRKKWIEVLSSPDIRAIFGDGE